MPDFTTNQWLIIVLVFVLGFILGMAAMASGKWKNRYREEVRRREASDAERGRLESQLRHAESRTTVVTARDPDELRDVRDVRDDPIA
jgi:uncharacterized membrane-anchored protein YhcB (DUF1043 family)